MVFVGVFMMPFYYGSRARSVPEYLKLRFDEKTRGFNALTFAVMTVFSSGISMYAMGALLALLLGWNIHASIVVVGGRRAACYIALGGLTSAIYNEVLQFFLIVFGFAPLVVARAARRRRLGRARGARARRRFVHSWRYIGRADANPMGVEWFGMVMGLGFVLSFGYWCTDFLVVQRAMAADSMNAARRTPLIAAVPKMLFPFLVILPGIIALGLTLQPNAGRGAAAADSSPRRLRLQHGAAADDVALLPAGLLGLGLTALLASFMSGMAGNVTAFNTVWTYDIYQCVHPAAARATRTTCGWGAMATVVGIAISDRDRLRRRCASTTSWTCCSWCSLRQRAAVRDVPARHVLAAHDRPRRILGARCRALRAAALHYELTAVPGGGVAARKLAVLHAYPSDMAQNFWGAIWAWTTCFAVTLVVSLVTGPRPQRPARGWSSG